MKKIHFIILGIVALSLVPVTVLAQEFVPLAEIPGLTDPVTANAPGFAIFFNNLYKYLIGLSAVLAVIMIIWGGLEYSTQDSISKKSDGKERIYAAIFGLVLVLSPVLVFSIINPAILNLSLNLEPVDNSYSKYIFDFGGSKSTTTKVCTAQGQGGCERAPQSNAGNYPAPQPNTYCFERKPIKNTFGELFSEQSTKNTFICETTQDLCEELYTVLANDDSTQVVSKCLLRY